MNNLFPPVPFAKQSSSPLTFSIKEKILEWSFKNTTPAEANDDLDASARRPVAPATDGAPISHNEKMINMRKEVDQDLEKIVIDAWPKIKKIFKMRMRSSTFPVINCADLGRVLRDIGLIENVKQAYPVLKAVWEE